MQLHSGSEGKGVCTQLSVELRAGKGLSSTTRGPPWSFSTVPMSSEGLYPEDVPGFGVRWPQCREVSSAGSGLGVWWADLLQAWSSVPRGCGRSSGPLLLPSMRHLDPGPLDGWKSISPSVTEAVAAGYKAC